MFVNRILDPETGYLGIILFSDLWLTIFSISDSFP